MIDFSTVVAVDERHAAEWEVTWPTWRKNRPELLDRPLLVICDADRSADDWRRRLAFVDHPKTKIVLWHSTISDQRERMLNALVLATARHVSTAWYLKLDTDVVAEPAAAWLCDDWFQNGDGDRTPVFVASPWGLHKARNLDCGSPSMGRYGGGTAAIRGAGDQDLP